MCVCVTVIWLAGDASIAVNCNCVTSWIASFSSLEGLHINIGH